MRPVLRLLPLPLCIAFSLAAQAAEDRPDDWGLCPVVDAVPAFLDAQQPVGKPEARVQLPTDIAGDQVAGTDTNPQFSGNVTFHRADQFLGADNFDYNTETGKYVAQGDVRYQDSGMRMVAGRAEGDQNADTHNIQDVRYQLMSRRGNGGAEHIEMHGAQGTLYGSTYSTCPPDDRRWELRAQRIDIDTAAGKGVAHNATLRVGRVPILYVPWFPFPLDDRRRTGLLYPSIGSSGRNGFDYRQPIYLNLAPNYDMTLTPRFMSARGLQLGAEFRYLTETGRGKFEAAYLPSDKLTDRKRQEEIDLGIPPENRRADNRGYFNFIGSQDLSRNWQARSQLNWISDTRYLEDFNNNLNGLSPFAVTSDIGLYGRGRYWNAGVMADHRQLADSTLTEAILPYNHLPRVWFNWEQPFTRWLTAGVDTEAVHFQHTTLPGGSRVDLKPFVSMPLEGAGWFVKPTLAWRYTGYKLDNDLAAELALAQAQAFATQNQILVTPELIARFNNDAPSRSLPIASLDAGLYFDREASWGGESFLQTLEPRLFYLRVPYQDQNDLPLFDTRPLTFSWGQLFRDNRYSGADRQTDANQLTLAVSSRLIRQSDGKEKLTVNLGQIRYFDASRVTVPGETQVERGNSAWVADANYAINDRWTIGASYQWDPKFRRQDLASVRTQYLVGDDGVVNFGYRYRRGLLEQADLSFLYPLTPAWSLVGRYYYSIQDRKLLEGIAGVQWDSCCLAVRVVGRRYVHNRAGELDNALMFEVELKGLGSGGQDTRRVLRRAILGYYREDISLVPPPAVRSGDVDNSPDPTP
ncbi:MAG TPA: LPS assembly protein LptD [Luteimonas sp.]|nr:LPS assembly protein LptD [Luteimonas sp.]